MNTLLVSGFGTKICVDKRRLIVENRLDNIRHEFYPHQIPYDSIVIDGHTGDITFEAMRWLAKHNINLTLLNWNGALLSTTMPREPISGKLKVKQYASYLDDDTRSYVAHNIIEEKVRKSLNLLEELSKFYAEVNLNAINKAVSREKAIFEKRKQSVNEIMTYEGRIANIYWLYLNKVFGKLYPNFNFQSRQNKLYRQGMNASDEVNALLNYGYAVLESEIRADINYIGLDADVGFLHEINSSKTPLVYDAQELFRWLVDKSVIELLEDGDIKKSDFIVTENYHVRLREGVAKKLIAKISLNMNKKVSYKGYPCTYQTILQEQIRKIASYVSGKTDSFKFDTPSFSLERNDSLALRKRILNTTPEEQRRLGMSKSGLWYRKKKIMEGKKIKVYNKVMSKINI